MSPSTRILVVGHRGRMGAICQTAIDEDNHLTLAATCGREDDLGAALSNAPIDVVIDVTVPSVIREHTQTYIDHQVPFVIGTSGLITEDIAHFEEQCRCRGLGGLIVPNFSLATVWLLRLSRLAAQDFDYVEIVEGHHERKVDAPSGTACHTADVIHEAREAICNQRPPLNQGLNDDKNQGSHTARGEWRHSIPIHALRSPGLLAEQQVIFGGDDETLTISQRTLSRRAFIPGIQLALKSVAKLSALQVGLDSLLD